MTEEQIYQEMLEVFRQETGYEMHTATDLAVRLRAAAAQLMSLYHYGDYVFRQAFPQTAEGESLGYHGTLRGVDRLEARNARGQLTFGISKVLGVDLAVPAGTVCLTGGGTAFVTEADAILPAGSLSVTAAAQAVEPGAAGNVLSGMVTRMQVKPDGIETVTNQTAFSGGRDRETDESYRKRILEAYQGVGNGANMAYYRELALSVEGIHRARVIPCINGAGTVGILVSSDAGAVSQDALDALESLLEQRKEFGITVVVSAPASVTVNITAKLQPVDGITFSSASEAVRNALENCFQGDRMGRDLYLAELISAAMATGTLENIQITSPGADVSVEDTQQAAPGSITLEGF